MLPDTRVAVIGCGYWGKNHVRIFRQLSALAAVCEPSSGGQAVAREIAPGVQIHTSTEELFAAVGIQGVVVATPAETHFAVTQAALRRAMMCLSRNRSRYAWSMGMLLQIARERNRILMIGHVLEYHPAIVRLGQLIAEGEMGTVRYVYSNRLNLGKIRREENILWSFAPHDISIMLRLIGKLPYEVIATGGAYVQPNIPDVTVTQLLFDNGVRGHIFVSWLHPYKEQRVDSGRVEKDGSIRRHIEGT